VTVIVLLEFQVKPEAIEGMKAMMKDVLPDTRSYPGCQGVDVGNDPDNPGSFVFCERWASRDHYEKYLSWRTATGMMDEFGSKLAGAPSVRHFNRADV
jgi:quinol monooxygenase YgiN